MYPVSNPTVFLGFGSYPIPQQDFKSSWESLEQLLLCFQSCYDLQCLANWVRSLKTFSSPSNLYDKHIRNLPRIQVEWLQCNVTWRPVRCQSEWAHVYDSYTSHNHLIIKLGARTTLGLGSFTIVPCWVIKRRKSRGNFTNRILSRWLTGSYCSTFELPARCLPNYAKMLECRLSNHRSSEIISSLKVLKYIRSGKGDKEVVLKIQQVSLLLFDLEKAFILWISVFYTMSGSDKSSLQASSGE